MSVQSSELVPSTPTPTSKRMALPPKDPSRVSPFRLKKIFAYKRNKANLDLFHMCFTISL